MAHQSQKSSPLATSEPVPFRATSSSPAQKAQGDNKSLRETIQTARRRSKEWPWEARLFHMGGYVAAAKVVAPAIKQVRSHDAGERRTKAGETASLADMGGLLNDTGSIAERGSVSGTSVAGTSVLN